jgi:hypothetical protein
MIEPLTRHLDAQEPKHLAWAFLALRATLTDVPPGAS